MLKKLFASSLLAVAALSASAAEGTVTYTYAGDALGAWGKGKSEIYDVAIRISDPALVGKKITSIRAAVNAYEGIESTSVWLTKELVLEKVGSVKVTVPDTYAAEVAPEKVALADGGVIGQLSSELETPYVLTEEGIYVGYSLTVPSVPKGQSLTSMQQNPILLSPCDNPESLYIRASKDFLKWMPYNDKLGGAAAIYVTLEGDFAEYSLGIKNLPSAFAKVGEDFTVKAYLSNIGATPVSKIGYSYSVDGKSFDKTLDLDAPIVPDFINSTMVEFPVEAISELGEHDFTLTVTSVNGGVNASVSASASSVVSVLPFIPVHRPMLEEFTGTWCGWCTRGYWALETLDKLYGDAVVLAAYHDGDPMQAPALPVNVSGYPSATLNRNGIEDPYFGNGNSGFGMKTEVVESMNTVVNAAIDVEAVWANTAKTEISVKGTATFLEDKAGAGYKIGYILINNGLFNESWAQSNYYSSYAGQMAGDDLEVLSTWPSSVTGLVFNDVVVDVSAMKGINGSVPADVAFNTPYVNEYTIDIAGNTVIQDKDKLYVAAFIIRPDGTILNSNKVKVVEGETTAVGALEAAEVSAEYYNLSGVRVAAPGKGVFVKVTRLSDGTVRTAKVVR